METALPESVENRRSERVDIRVPIKLEIKDQAAATIKTILGYTANINRHGLRLHVGTDTPLLKDTLVTVHLDGAQPHLPMTMHAKLLWHANSQCGINFNEEYKDVEQLIQSLSAIFNATPSSIKKFLAYVNDEDVDTNKYEFFPYADKFITDFRGAREYIAQLKRGQNAVGAESYIYAQYAIASQEINRLAIHSAYNAFKEFRKFSLEKRRKILDDIRELLIQEKETLLELMKIEGHPRKLAEWEYAGMLTAHLKESLDYYQSEMIKTIGQQGKETLITIRRPEGVICVCPPKNASCSNSLTASFALLAGNTLIIKPPLNAPISTIYLWKNIVGKALKINGAPKGTINIVVGNSKQFMEEWLNSPLIRGILMFNDSEVGLELGRQIYEKGKKPILELSGNDYMLIWKDAPIEQAVESLLDAFMGSTQICMVPKKALIHEDIYEKFIGAFIKRVRDLKIALPSDPETILSPVIKIKDYFDSLNEALASGGKLLTGGKRVNFRGEDDKDGFYILPTVVEIPISVAGSLRCINEENFFPLLPVVKISGVGNINRERDQSIFDTMINFLDQNKYGLRISAWVKDPVYLRKFIDEANHSGLLRLNSRHIGFSTCLSTHGGIGKSGGPFGEMNYVWQKTSYLQGISVTKLDLDHLS